MARISESGFVRLVGLMALGGCASSGASAPPSPEAQPVELRRGIEGTQTVIQQGAVVTATVDAPMQPAWTALQAAYGDLGMKVTVRDAMAHQLGSEGLRLVRLADHRASWYVDCGSDLSGPIADNARVLVTVLTALQAHPGGGIDVGTKLNAEARYRGALEGVRDCASTGKLEAAIVQRLQEHLKS
jgi:hypothetical protein